MTRCRRCIMPEVEDRIILDQEGVCNICRKNEKIKFKDVVKRKYSVEALVKKIETYKTVSPDGYDCVVSVSGGKDSIMVLYLAKEKLNLNPLGVFIDNGFTTPDLYKNAQNAADSLGVDLVIFKTSLFKKIFRYILLKKQPFYYCRLCHGIIEKVIHDIAHKFGISLILGGFTKGQDYLKLQELYWIFELTDSFILNELSKEPEFKSIAEMFPNNTKYFSENYQGIHSLSPLWYMKWDEDEIIATISKKVGFKVPGKSWPDRSSNCLFNFVSQHLAVKQFGYSQHEPELSTLVRSLEITRERAVEIINTPIESETIASILDTIDLTYNDIV